MHLHQLINTFEDIQTIFEQNNLFKKYQTVVDYCYQLANDVNNEEIKNQLHLEKNAIIEVHKQIEPILWHDASFNCLHSAKNEQLLGLDFIKKFTNIVSLNNTYFNRIADEISLISQNTKNWMQQVNSFIENSKNWNAILPEYLTNNENKCSIKVFFTQSTYVKTLYELERNTRIWNNIFNAFAQLVDHTPQELYVYAIEQGFLIVKVPCKVTEAFSSAMIEILSTYRKLLEIKKIKLDLALLSLNNQEEIEKLLDDETKIQIEQIAFDITNNLLDNYFANKFNTNEISESISISIKQIMNFVEKGGKMDIDTFDNNIILNKKEEMIDLFNRIIELENNIKEKSIANNPNTD